MGNKPARNGKIHQPYNQMVEDAITALKDRPGATQSDIFKHLETKYDGRISPRVKKNLETVIRSVMKTKQGLKRGGGRPPTRSTGVSSRRDRSTGMSSRRDRSKAKAGSGRNSGRLLQRGKARKVTRFGKDVKKRTLRTVKSGKKLVMPRSKPGGQRLRRTTRGTSRGCRLRIVPASRKSSVGSMGLPRRLKESSFRNRIL